MKIQEINGEYYVFRVPGKVCMTVREFPYERKLVRSDTGFLGDKHVPDDIQRAIRSFQAKAERRSARAAKAELDNRQ